MFNTDDNLNFKTPFSTKITGEIGEYKTIHIYMNGEKIGEYTRNYPAFAKETFYPFLLKGKWYALYSADYTCTRIMTLPDCKDIGGEESDSCGFCSTELFVPAFRRSQLALKMKDTKNNCEKTVIRNHCHFEGSNRLKEIIDAIEKQNIPNDKRKSHYTLEEWQHTPFGFVSGCYWGDDSSWKVQFLDLSNADKGIIKRDDRFEYWELPYNLTIKEAVNIRSEDGVNFSAHIARMQYFSGLMKSEEEFKKMNEENYYRG